MVIGWRGPMSNKYWRLSASASPRFDRVRLSQGVVGKSSYVAGLALLALLIVAYSLRDSGYLLALAGLIMILFFGYFAGVLWFANKHPDMALLEGG
jgi:hypothetical protein